MTLRIINTATRRAVDFLNVNNKRLYGVVSMVSVDRRGAVIELDDEDYDSIIDMIEAAGLYYEASDDNIQNKTSITRNIEKLKSRLKRCSQEDFLSIMRRIKVAESKIAGSKGEGLMTPWSPLDKTSSTRVREAQIAPRLKHFRP